ncbi:MAG: hypothetical protein ABIQ16_16855 [Polyangiaceae bacterium]
MRSRVVTEQLASCIPCATDAANATDATDATDATNATNATNASHRAILGALRLTSRRSHPKTGP